MLDFELAAFPGAWTLRAAARRATCRQNRTTRRPRSLADIFALGASLAHAALGVDPADACARRWPSARVARSPPDKCALRDRRGGDARRSAKAPDRVRTGNAIGAIAGRMAQHLAKVAKPRTHARKIKARRLRKIMEAANAVRRSFIKDHLAQSRPIVPSPGPSPHAIASGLAGNIVGLAAIDFATRRVVSTASYLPPPRCWRVMSNKPGARLLYRPGRHSVRAGVGRAKIRADRLARHRPAAFRCGG